MSLARDLGDAINAKKQGDLDFARREDAWDSAGVKFMGEDLCRYDTSAEASDGDLDFCMGIQAAYFLYVLMNLIEGTIGDHLSGPAGKQGKCRQPINF